MFTGRTHIRTDVVCMSLLLVLISCVDFNDRFQKVRPGMTEAEVIRLLGAPSVTLDISEISIHAIAHCDKRRAASVLAYRRKPDRLHYVVLDKSRVVVCTSVVSSPITE